MTFDLVLEGGEVVGSRWSGRADIGVSNGRISAIGMLDNAGASRRIDVSGCEIYPGGVDPHTHIHWPFLETTTRDNFEMASVAALHGGTTSVIDWARPVDGSALQGIMRRRQQASEQCIVVDYGLHCILTDGLAEGLEEMSKIVGEGLPTFKCYMTYRARGLLVDDGFLLRALERARDLGGIVGVHAENPFLHERTEQEYRREGRVAPIDFRTAKGNLVEAEAIHRAIYIAGAVDAPLMIQHVSTAEGVEAIRQARRRGQGVWAETCPHYLVLTDEVYRREDGRNYICSPPIKSTDDQSALWAGLADGTLSIVGADHGAFSLADKAVGDGAFDVPNGLPGVETRFPLLYHHGVKGGRISKERFCELISENPARIGGIYPQKGTICVGADADLAIVDPTLRSQIRAERLHQGVDWTPYEGMFVHGFPTLTVLRGEAVVESGRYAPPSHLGTFLPGITKGFASV